MSPQNRGGFSLFAVNEDSAFRQAFGNTFRVFGLLAAQDDRDSVTKLSQCCDLVVTVLSQKRHLQEVY
ncbi:hypothetical protein HM1_3039 [Heliomicrobium modesticaldum Ice1]|uniref:Uncharacterized protein n=1 Tax=Heliobacterium modesticaldum (strain ATCC 51547 / Ice1) TaxID=498761 RepID=B0TDM1_HELMI|nr:hypothetical protein HM1_3039 [Heliomicrobium modesticaldum Ice1]